MNLRGVGKTRNFNLKCSMTQIPDSKESLGSRHLIWCLGPPEHLGSNPGSGS